MMNVEQKKLQEATGPGRYILNVPGNGPTPLFFNDPQIRMQKWGANLKDVVNGAPIDIDSKLSGRTQKLEKYDIVKSKMKDLNTVNKSYPVFKDAVTDESRATHPSWKYRALPQNREYPLFLNPQKIYVLDFIII